MKQVLRKTFYIVAGIFSLLVTPVLFPLGHFFNDIEIEEDWKSYKCALIQMIFDYNIIEGKWG